MNSSLFFFLTSKLKARSWLWALGMFVLKALQGQIRRAKLSVECEQTVELIFTIRWTVIFIRWKCNSEFLLSARHESIRSKDRDGKKKRQAKCDCMNWGIFSRTRSALSRSWKQKWGRVRGREVNDLCIPFRHATSSYYINPSVALMIEVFSRHEFQKYFSWVTRENLVFICNVFLFRAAETFRTSSSSEFSSIYKASQHRHVNLSLVEGVANKRYLVSSSFHWNAGGRVDNERRVESQSVP